MSIGAALYPSLTAMNAFGYGLQSTAHNLANVATNGFKPGRINYMDLPRQAGVAAWGPQKLDAQGPLVPYGPGLPPSGAGAGVPEGFAIGSATDIATEMVNLIVVSRSYQANAKVASTVDFLLGTAVNLKV